jgi:PAS domain S-box-containing protein
MSDDRLDALSSFRILDTLPEPQFDEIVQAASTICEAPVALISFVAEDRQWFKARVGFEACETPLEQSICVHAIAQRAAVIIPDLRLDPRTAANPLVTAEDGIRFYAGEPLVAAGGHVLGTLCVIDRLPRPGGLTPQQSTMLQILARQVVAQLELRKALDEVRHSEARYRTLFDALDAAYCIIEMKFDAAGKAVDYRFVEVNAAFEPRTGLADAVGKWMRDLAPNHEQRWFDIYGDVARTGNTIRFEETAAALGRYYDVQAYRVGNPERNLVGVLFRDMSAQRRLEHEAREARERLELALSASHSIGTWDWDVKANIVKADRRFAALYGIDPALAAAGAPIEAFFGNVEPDDLPGLRAAIDKTLRQRVPFRAEYRLLKHDGSVCWVEASGACTFDAHGNPLQFPGVSSDITERMEASKRQTALIALGDGLRGLGDATAMAALGARVMGETLDALRAGQGRVDHSRETVTIDIDWNAPGNSSIAGEHSFRDVGSYIDDLKLGRTVVIENVETDRRTQDVAKTSLGIGVVAMVSVPILERGLLVAIALVQDNRPRRWSAEELAFITSVGDRTQAAIQRLHAERQQRLLNEEMSHRLKNSLAMVMSIASQTLRAETDPAAFRAYEDRVLTLSKAHDILLRQHWASADLATVVCEALALHADAARIEISGSSLSVGPRTALSAALLLHELATNAIKYGALSTGGGKVAVTWHVEGSAPDAELVLTWRERGGPTPQEPTRRGFGSRLIRIGLGTGTSEVRYPPSGVIATFRAPLSLATSN